MKTYYVGRRMRLLRIAVLTVLSGIVANGACARDASDPVTVRSIDRVTANLQDWDIVPDGDFSNPGALEPYGSLWSALDDALPSEDCCYVFRNRLGLPATYSQATVDLVDPAGTPDANQRHTMKVKFMVSGNYSTTTPQPTLLRYDLFQGETLITGKTVYPNGSNWVIDSVDVGGAGITYYPHLRIRLSMQLKPAGDFDQIQGRVAWARLEVR